MWFPKWPTLLITAYKLDVGSDLRQNDEQGVPNFLKGKRRPWRRRWKRSLACLLIPSDPDQLSLFQHVQLSVSIYPSTWLPTSPLCLFIHHRWGLRRRVPAECPYVGYTVYTHLLSSTYLSNLCLRPLRVFALIIRPANLLHSPTALPCYRTSAYQYLY